ncbi:copia protein [Tanacetum coccineum]|uniref:Copia protein n=1 Tax=Tanacetum coccineum TaxID=301880 RepID=A0ABQ4YX58_9ASTR
MQASISYCFYFLALSNNKISSWDGAVLTYEPVWATRTGKVASLEQAQENRPPMLKKGSYVPWPSRFMRYIDEKKEYGKMLKDSIENDPYKMKEINDQGNPDGNPPVLPLQIIQKEADLKDDEKKRFKAEIDAINTFLLGIPNDIYNSVDACKTAQAMWLWVKRRMQGTDLRKHELTSRLVDEFDKFKGMPRESIESYYLRFSKIMNDLERHDKYVTMVWKTKNLHEVDYDQLYDYLKQNEKNVNASRAKRATRTHSPLALVANHYVAPSSSHTQSSYYVTYPPLVADFDVEPQSFEFQGDATNDNPTDNLTTTMMLLAKVTTQHYSTPTNNRLRASSNTCNQLYVQDGRVNVQSMNARNASRNTGKVTGNSRYATFGQQANGNNATVQQVPRTSATGNSEYDTQNNNAHDQIKAEFELLIQNVQLEAVES